MEHLKIALLSIGALLVALGALWVGANIYAAWVWMRIVFWRWRE